MTTSPDRPQASVAAFKALAHPLRVKMFHALGRRPATATMLAEALGESTGSTSYHLRQLARHGLIEEDAGRGTGRERWWRPAGTGLSVSPATLLENQDAARIITDSTLDEWHLEARRGFQRAISGSVPAQVADLLSLSQYGLIGTPEEFQDLFGRIEDLLSPFLTSNREEGPDTVRVSAQLIAYPEA